MGRAGNDTLNGGGQFDTAVYSGNAADYSYTPIMVGGKIVGFSSVTDNNLANGDEGTDTLNSVEALRFADMTVSATGPVYLFDQNGNLVNSYLTIQAAVDASFDNYSIVISAGTYVEQVVVNGVDGLTIQAVLGADVNIRAPADLVQTELSSSDREVHAVLTVRNSDNVTIEGIDIEGNGAGNTVDEGTGTGEAAFYGIFLRNSSGSVIDTDITGVRDPYPGGTAAGGEPLQNFFSRGVGVGLDNDVMKSFTWQGGLVTDFQKGGAFLRGGNLNVTGVTITGGGAQTLNAQNGIQVAESSGSISGNTIRGIGFAGAVNTYATAILGYQNTDLNITGNIIRGANTSNGTTNNVPAARVIGIYVGDFGDPIYGSSGGSITGNTITFVDVGIDISGSLTPNGIFVATNTITNLDTSGPDDAGVTHLPTETLATVFDVDGSAAADVLSGAAGNDILAGLGGADILEGNGGNDTLGGGNQTDTAVYNGVLADYTITYTRNAAGFVTSFATVTDNNPGGGGDDGADTLTLVEVLQFTDVTLNAAGPVQLFDASDVLVGSFATIQAAIDAASTGYFIRAAAGTYTEQLTVNKDVSIYGANFGIDGTGGRGAETIINGAIKVTVDGVTLDGVKVIGTTPVSTFFPGIYVTGDDFSLANSVLDGPDTPTTGVGTVSVLVDAGVTGLDIGHNLLTGYLRGVWIIGGAVEGEIHDNRFQGDGPPHSGTGLANAINSESSLTTIHDNIFDGIYAGVVNVNPRGPTATIDIESYIFDNTYTNNLGPRVIQVYATPETQNFIGSDENETFNGDYLYGPAARVRAPLMAEAATTASMAASAISWILCRAARATTAPRAMPITTSSPATRATISCSAMMAMIF